MKKGRVKIYQRLIKRPMDLVLSLITIIALSPLFLVLVVLVKIKLGSPILFKQSRPGLEEKIFTLYKFRTMTKDRDENCELRSDGERLNKFGRLLRSTSLDELPELFNILKGDMSIVGPRPLLTQYLPLYNEYQKRRHEVRPGLSGLAQVNGRNAIHWEDKFTFDIEYVDHVTFIGDWRIIFMTMKKVFIREGISSETAATIETFKGNAKEKLLIIGAGGHGKVVADIARRMNRWKQIAYLDDDKLLQSLMNIDVIGKSSDAHIYIKEYDICVAIGNNAIREKIQNELELVGATMPIIMHPSSVIGEQVTIGDGTVLMAGVVINCCSRIGKGCIINTAATIDHDNVVEDYVHISPGAHLAGTVYIGKCTWLGIGSIVKNNVNITNNCKVGAGAVVVKDITEVGTYIGVPARSV